jgi:hypothetical protein
MIMRLFPCLPFAVALLSVVPVTAHAAVRHDPTYIVEVENFSSQDFDEIVLAFTRHSDPVARILHQPNVPHDSVVSFDLGPCADVRQYAVSGIVGGERVVTTGDVDGDPSSCNDVITIGNAQPKAER